MATKRKSSTPSASRNIASRNIARMISPEEVESFDYDLTVKTAYIEEMNGSVYYRDTKAGIAIRIFEAEDVGKQLRSMANLIAKSNCTAEGELIYESDQDALDRLTNSAIEAIAVGIARASQNERENKEKKGGNASRR